MESKTTMRQKIIYEPLKIEDSTEFFHLAGDRRVAATMRFDCPKDRAESDRVLTDYLAAGNRTFALRFQPGDSLWGIFSFKACSEADTADLSQMQLPTQWGHHLGEQVLQDMVALAQSRQWYKALEGHVLETNTASRRMAERNGFREKTRFFLPDMKEDLVVYRLELPKQPSPSAPS